MSKYWLLFTLLVSGILGYYYLNTLSSTHAFPTIQSYEEVDSSAYDATTLVTFDIDDTLITAHDALAQQISSTPWYFKAIALFRYPFLRKHKEFENITSLVFDQAQQKLIENAAVNFINNLKKQGCNVIGLTAMDTGSWGVIESMSVWRYDMLKSMGVNFTSTFPNRVFSSLPQYRGNYPELYKGIICANHQPKGKVLKALIEQQKIKPSRVLSFDDSQSSLYSIAKECKEMGIEFVGYHYLGAQQHAKTFNLKRALLQLDTLVTQQKWLSDDQADSILQPAT